MEKCDSVLASLEAADDWEQKGELTWVEHCISSALMTSLSVSVTEYSRSTEAISWLSQVNVTGMLRRFREVNEQLAAEVDAGHRPPAVIGGNFHVLALAHTAFLVDEFHLGRAFIQFANRKDVRDLSTPFWREYAKAAESLIRMTPYGVPPLKLRGQEKYWGTYLHFIQAVTHRAPLDEPIRNIDKAFATRNSDKSIRDDNYTTEGSGSAPVQWDYRRESLLKYVEREIKP